MGDFLFLMGMSSAWNHSFKGGGESDRKDWQDNPLHLSGFSLSSSQKTAYIYMEATLTVN